jgi:hypothetical protein
LLSAACVAQNRPDPCQVPSVAKQSAVINISSAATTALVTVSGNTKVYVCGFSFTILGLATTGGTAQFESGTGVACASTAAALTGSFLGVNTAGASTLIMSPGDSGSLFTAPAANGLCLVTTGTSPSVQGYVTFVQQ